MPACGAHQFCRARVCTCDSGYTGPGCASCAAGYVKDSSGAVCVKQSCGAAPCKNGEQKCQSGQLQTCSVGVDGCLAFGAAKPCNDGGCWCPTGDTKVSAQQWGGGGSDSAFGVTIGSAGEAVATGWHNVSMPNRAMFVGAHHPGADVAKDWMQEWPSHGQWDKGAGVRCDANGAVFVAGAVSAALPGQTLLGGTDLAVGKWGADHSSAWNAQWGTTSTDRLDAIAADSAGNTFVVGATDGSLSATNPMPGDEDMLLAKLDPSGKLKWTVQWGGTGRDELAAIAIDAQDAIFVAGVLNGDVYCSKRDSNGAKLWETSWGSSSADSAAGIAVSTSGELFVVGFFGGSVVAQGIAPGPFVSKLSSSGSVQWNHTLGVPGSGGATAIARGPNGDFFVTGQTQGELVTGSNHGNNDIFVYRIQPDGTPLWTKQLGTAGSDTAYGLAVAADETIYIAADTFDAYPGFVNQGMVDAVLLRIAP